MGKRNGYYSAKEPQRTQFPALRPDPSPLPEDHHRQRRQRHRNTVRPVVTGLEPARNHAAIADIRSAEEFRIGVQNLFVKTFFRYADFIALRSEEHTSESSHLVISYAVFCLKKKKKTQNIDTTQHAAHPLRAWRQA